MNSQLKKLIKIIEPDLAQIQYKSRANIAGELSEQCVSDLRVPQGSVL